MLHPDLQKIKEIVQPLLEEEWLELFDINFSYQADRIILRFLVDKPRGGITIEECAQLSQKISNLLDNQGVLEGSYLLEVSSPGIDRPLKTERDFLRAKDRNVVFYLCEAIMGKKEIKGIVKKISENIVTIDVDATEVRIPLEKINKAKQVLE